MEAYDSRGPKRAFIYSLCDSSDTCAVEAQNMKTKLENLGFEFLEDDLDLCMDLNAMELMMELKKVNETCKDASCILIYIMASQEGLHLVTDSGKQLKIHLIWKVFTQESSSPLINIPKLIFLQAKVNDRDSIPVTLMNKDGEDGGEDDFTLPASCNMLLFYYPMYCSQGEDQPQLSTFIFGEIERKSDLLTNLTSVLAKIMAKNISGAKFSSSLTKQLYLRGRDDNEEPQSLPGYGMERNGKRLAYAFVFERFLEFRNLSALAPLDIEELSHTFGKNGLNFELDFCVKNGIMDVVGFKDKLNDIIHSIEEDKNHSVECLVIIISSHGHKNGTLFAHDGKFNVDDIWIPLANCKALKDRPVLLFLDACRGIEQEKGVTAPNKGQSSKSNDKGEQTRTDTLQKTGQGNSEPQPELERPEMRDLLLAMSSTEGTKSYGSSAGSYFIQELCRVINMHGKKHDLITLLTQVMNTISKQQVFGESKQQVTFTTTLQKPYFFGGRQFQ